MAIWKIIRSHVCTQGICSWVAIDTLDQNRLTLDQQLINISIDTQLTLSAVCQKSAECELIHMHQSKICYLNRLSTEMSIESQLTLNHRWLLYTQSRFSNWNKQGHNQMNHVIFSHIMPGAGCPAAWLFRKIGNLWWKKKGDIETLFQKYEN